MAFSAEWLSLREPADRAARSSRVVQRVIERLSSERPLNVVDLGCGTGANVRVLSEALPKPQRWRLVDNDKSLLETALVRSVRLQADLPEVRFDTTYYTEQVDLAKANLDDLTRSQHLVTASALLDLVSERWLRALVHACRSHEASVLFALIYDGGMTCTPRDPDDDLIRDLVNRHQRGDKGFGPALGPTATDVAQHLLREAGYATERDSSDWTLGPDTQDLQSALITGWADAGIELAPERADTIRAWSARRLAHVARGQSRITVGHCDVSGTL